MRQINIFINLFFLFLIILLILTLTHTLFNNKILQIIENKNFIRYILYNIIVNYNQFIIFALALTFILYYGFSPISLFKSKHYRIFIITPALLLTFGIFYFENFYFTKKNKFISEIKKIENDALKNIDYKKFLNDKIEKLNGNFFIILKDKKNVTGFYIDNEKINYLTPQIIRKNILDEIKSRKQTNWEKIKYPFNAIYIYIFLIFILIPLALLFNNENWYLRTAIFLIITLPLYILAFKYLNKFIFNLKIKIQLPFWLPVKINELLLILIYIIIGNFLFKLADSLRNIKARIELEKVKRISK